MNEGFSHYEQFLSLTGQYGGMKEFESCLKQAKAMGENAALHRELGTEFSQSGRKRYGRFEGAQDFVLPALECIEAANNGKIQRANELAAQALQYHKVFKGIFFRSAR